MAETTRDARKKLKSVIRDIQMRITRDRRATPLHQIAIIKSMGPEYPFETLATDLPSLFYEFLKTPDNIVEAVDTALSISELATCWNDDFVCGWIHTAWNECDLEALDKRVLNGDKVKPHEIARKTQFFTDRYMVEWLLHNSLGLTWLSMCKKNGWKPDAEMVLADLDRRRADWRKKREAGEVALEALMPINGGLEERWKYYVHQPIPDDAIVSAPDSIRSLKLMDPAVGTGNFLFVAFDLLTELYREEARHRQESWSDRFIAESIVENNLYAVDIDSEVIRLCAAGLYMKVKKFCREARIRKLNIVSTQSLPEPMNYTGALYKHGE